MTNKIFVMGKEEITPGTKKTVLFPAPNLNTQIEINIPVHVFHGKHRGPKIFITSAIHGDELNSIEIVRRIHELIRVQKLHGTIITVPVVNIYGMVLQTRYLADRRDLNRAFPGTKKGTLAARLAHGLLEQVVKHCDYGIDLHTGAYGRVNMPQLRADFSVKNTKNFAMSFNAPVILDAKQRSGSLRQAASTLGIPVIVYEGGEALRFNEYSIRGGVHGILSVLHHLGMMKSHNKAITKKSKSIITKTSRWLRAPASGIVEPVTDSLAKPVKKGEVLAYIHDPFLMKPSTKLIAPFKGIVIGQALKAMATEGDALYHVASFKNIAGIRAYIDEYQENMAT